MTPFTPVKNLAFDTCPACHLSKQMNDTFIAGKLYKPTFVDYLLSSSGKTPNKFKTDNQIVPRTRSPPRSILVIPRTPEAASMTEPEDFSRVNDNGTLYAIEENGTLGNFEGVSSTDSEQIRPRQEPDYQGILNARIPIANQRPGAGSTDHRPMVEVPDNVLPSPSSIASRPPQLPRSRVMGSENSGWSSGQAHTNNPRYRPGNEQFHGMPPYEERAEGNQGPPSPPPVVNIAGAPYLHIYNLYAHHGQHVAKYHMGSSVQHTAVDINTDEGPHQIRIWYSPPQ